MEKRDLYDDNKKLTDKFIYKGDTVPKGYYYITVVIFIQNDLDELLIQKNKKYNKWSITGGHPVSGESSIDGAISELKEELDLVIDKKDLTLFDTIKTDDDFVDLYYLKKNIDLKDINIQKEEVSDVMWVNYKEIEKMIKSNEFLLPHIVFYRKLIKYLKGSDLDGLHM